MTTDQILKVLRNERECIMRQGDIQKCCNRECGRCDLCLPDNEILEVYDHLIKITETSAIIVDVSEEDKKKLLQSMANHGYQIAPDLIEKYGIEVKGDTE